MPVKVKALASTEVKSAKPQEKAYNLNDGDGLSLRVEPSGTRRWLFSYRLNKKRKTYTFGSYPQISLKEARDNRDKFRSMVRDGVDPNPKNQILGVTRKDENFNELKSLLDDYIKTRNDISDAHREDIYKKVSNNIVPHFNNVPLQSIQHSSFVKIFKQIADRGASETSRRLFGMIDKMFRYATTVGLMEYNPLGNIDINVLVPKKKAQNFAHIDNKKELAELLSDLEDYKGDVSTMICLRLASHIFLRSNPLRHIEWKEIDFEEKMLYIPASKMKMDREHIVPLSKKVIALFKQIEPITRHKSIYVFPSPYSNSKPISEGTLTVALKRIGYKGRMTVHGFRHTASTFLHENMYVHNVHSDAIEMQMAHKPRGVKAIYNKAQYIEERKRLMEWWSDFLYDLF